MVVEAASPRGCWWPTPAGCSRRGPGRARARPRQPAHRSRPDARALPGAARGGVVPDPAGRRPRGRPGRRSAGRRAGRVGGRPTSCRSTPRSCARAPTSTPSSTATRRRCCSPGWRACRCARCSAPTTSRRRGWRSRACRSTRGRCSCRSPALGREVAAALGAASVLVLRGHGIATVGSGEHAVEQAVCPRARARRAGPGVRWESARLGGRAQELTPEDVAELPDLGGSFNDVMVFRHQLARLRHEGLLVDG